MIAALFDNSWDALDRFLVLRAAARQWCEVGDDCPLWRLVHYLTDIKTWAVCLMPVLLLQRASPARPPARSALTSFVFDWSYPVLTIGISSWLVLPVVQGVYDFGKSHLSLGFSDYIGTWPLIIKIMFAFVLQDFLRYVSHFLRHKIRWLWSFHAIHHSQVNMNPCTTHRTHPFEAMVGSFLITLPIGVLGIEPVPWIYAGVTSMFWDLFLHLNVRTNLGQLGKVIVSPQYNRVHHSALQEHYDCNYGERLVLWDLIFGTLCRDRSVYPPTGCPESSLLMERPKGMFWIPQYWFQQFFYPFRQISSLGRGRIDH